MAKYCDQSVTQTAFYTAIFVFCLWWQGSESKIDCWIIWTFSMCCFNFYGKINDISTIMGAGGCFYVWICWKKIRGGKNGAQNNWIKYIPYPILCKSHTIDNLKNTDVLSRLEKSVSLREAFESINPALKPIFPWQDCYS